MNHHGMLPRSLVLLLPLLSAVRLLILQRLASSKQPIVRPKLCMVDEPCTDWSGPHFSLTAIFTVKFQN